MKRSHVFHFCHHFKLDVLPVLWCVRYFVKYCKGVFHVIAHLSILICFLLSSVARKICIASEPFTLHVGDCTKHVTWGPCKFIIFVLDSLLEILLFCYFNLSWVVHSKLPIWMEDWPTLYVPIFLI